jgi:hypothetical protein
VVPDLLETTKSVRPVDGLEHVLDRARIRGVEQEHVREAHLGAEGLVEGLAGQGRAAHTEENHLGVLQPADLVGERANVLGMAAHDGG